MATTPVAPPPGFVLDNAAPPPGFVIDSPQTPSPPFLNPGGEAAATLATGSVATPLSGLAGIAGAVLPGPQGQGADWAEKLRNLLTYQPRSQMGRDVVNTITTPFQKLDQLTQRAGGAVTDVTGSPLAGTAVKTGLDFLPSLVAKGLKGPVAKVNADIKAGLPTIKALGPVKGETWKRAIDEGYRFPPSATGGTFFSNKLESAGGKAAIGQESAIRNQAITDQAMARDAGIPPGQPITLTTLDAAKDAMSQPYRDVAALSPIARTALKRLNDARDNARAAWKSYKAIPTQKTLAEAKNYDRLASTYENVIDRQAVQLGKPDLLAQLRQARIDIAKNRDVLRAWNPGTGEVNANVVGRMYDKDKGAKMTGNAETVGRTALAFRPYMREGSSIPTPGVSKSEALAAALLGLAGNATGAGAWPMGLPLVGGLARSWALSDFMQPTTPGLFMQGAGLATGVPLGYTFIPGLGMIQTQQNEVKPY